MTLTHVITFNVVSGVDIYVSTLGGLCPNLLQISSLQGKLFNKEK